MGVVTVVIELERLSRFLTGVPVGKTGTVVILDGEGHVVAAPDPEAIRQQEAGNMPALDDLARRGNRLLGLVDGLLTQGRLPPATVTETRPLDVVGPDGRRYFVALASLRFERWVVATVIPADDFLATIERNARLLLLGLVALTLAMAAAVWAAHRLVARPLLRVTRQLQHIESFRLEHITRLPSPLREVDELSGALVQMSRGLASFQKYMPTELVRTLVARGVEARPGARQETLTVMFTDLAGFTGLSERLGDGVIGPLTEYLEATTQAVVSGGGTIDKFIGDAVMAFWGAPVPNPRHARDACAAALECQRRLAERLAGGDGHGRSIGVALRMRIGLNTGRVLVAPRGLPPRRWRAADRGPARGARGMATASEQARGASDAGGRAGDDNHRHTPSLIERGGRAPGCPSWAARSPRLRARRRARRRASRTG